MFPSGNIFYKQTIKSMLVSTRSIKLLINCKFGISFALLVSKINPRKAAFSWRRQILSFRKDAGSDIFDDVYSPDSDM